MVRIVLLFGIRMFAGAALLTPAVRRRYWRIPRPPTFRVVLGTTLRGTISRRRHLRATPPTSDRVGAEGAMFSSMR